MTRLSSETFSRHLLYLSCSRCDSISSVRWLDWSRGLLVIPIKHCSSFLFVLCSHSQTQTCQNSQRSYSIQLQLHYEHNNWILNCDSILEASFLFDLWIFRLKRFCNSKVNFSISVCFFGCFAFIFIKVTGDVWKATINFRRACLLADRHLHIRKAICERYCVFSAYKLPGVWDYTSAYINMKC